MQTILPLIEEKVMNECMTSLSGIFPRVPNDFNETVTATWEFVNQLGIKMLEIYFNHVQEKINDHPIRRQNWVVQRKADQRTIATLLGDVTLTRNYYKHRTTGEFSYLLDEQIELEPNVRMDMGVKTKMLELAVNMSYQKTIEYLPQIGIQSRSSVMHVVHQEIDTDSLQLEISSPKRQVETLYIEADEDHVAYQDGTNRFMKLVYVHEGFQENIGKERRQLTHTHYFTGRYEDNTELWEEVGQYIEDCYDTDKVKQIYLSGDGASWIKAGTRFLPNTLFVLNKFHLMKAVKKACVGLPVTDVSSTLIRWIYGGKKNWLRDFFQVRLLDENLTSPQKKTLEKMQSYLMTNWVAIQRQKDSQVIGCSAEGHVSHLLSARLSSRPLGWSERGAENVAKYRVYIYNGGSVKEYMWKSDKKRRTKRREKTVDTRVNSLYHKAERKPYELPIMHSSNVGTKVRIKHILSVNSESK